MAASPPATDWDAVAGIQPGTPVRVRLASGESHRGELRSAAADSMRIAIGGNDFTASKQEVVRVDAQQASRRKRNALLYGMIGVGAGIGTAFVTCPTCQGELPTGQYTRRLTLAGVGGGAIGAAIGALIPPFRTIYKR